MSPLSDDFLTVVVKLRLIIATHLRTCAQHKMNQTTTQYLCIFLHSVKHA